MNDFRRDVILIVNDDNHLSLRLRLQLQEAGYQSFIASTLEAFTDLVVKHPVSLALIDWELSEQKWGVAVERGNAVGIPALVMIPLGAENIGFQALEMGAVDYVEKPWRTDELLQKVKRAIAVSKIKKEAGVVESESAQGPTTSVEMILLDDDREGSSSAPCKLGPTTVEDVSTTDYLGRERYTNALARLLRLRQDTRPFAIGLFGEWGSGKSSQIAQLKALLAQKEEPFIRFAEFNAWAHEGANNIAAALAQSVVDAFIDDLGFYEQLKLAAKLARLRRSKTIAAIERDRINFLVVLIESWAVWPPVALALIFAFFSIYLFLNNSVELGLCTFILAIPTSIASYFGGLHFISKNLSAWFKSLTFKKPPPKLKLPDYTNELGLHHDIQKNLQHLCKLRQRSCTDPAKGDYLLLIVDDLDRCGPETVKGVFDAVRLVAHIPRVVTLVAIDERMAFSAVKQHYNNLGHAGREPALVARDYLAKVFQVAIALPRPEDRHVRYLVEDKLFEGGTALDLQDRQDLHSDISISAIGKNTSSTLHSNLPDQQSSEFDGGQKDVTVDGEKELFAELAISYNFRNPRLLWRLLQSWRILKSIVFVDEYSLAAAESWIKLLFWREWLFQQSSTTREALQSWPFSDTPAILPEMVLHSLPANIRAEDYEEKCTYADAVLLPAGGL